MRWILWMIVFTMLAFGVWDALGCAPQSVKQSAAMTGEILVKAQAVATAPVLPEEDLAPRLAAIGGMLGDGIGLLESIEIYLGRPNSVMLYTPGNAVALATKAQADAELRVALREVMAELVPEFIKKPAEKSFAWLESILAVIGAYGGTKLTVAGLKAVKKKKG